MEILLIVFVSYYRSDIFSLKLSLERDFFQIAKGFHLGKTGNRNSYCSDFGCRGLGGDVNH